MATLINDKQRNKSILEMEKRLNELVENDIYNEEIYHILKKMAYIYINQNKLTSGYSGVEDVCHDVAADLWMSVINGRKVKAWMYYIRKMIKLSYIPNQKNIEYEIIDVSGDPELNDSIKRMCASWSISCLKDFDDMERNLMLDSIPTMIQETLNHIKYKRGSLEWTMIYTNVCINLLRELYGLDYVWFRINENLKLHVHIAIEQFKKDFRSSGFTDSITDGVDDEAKLSLIGFTF